MMLGLGEDAGSTTTIAVCRDCSSLTGEQYEAPGGDYNCCGSHPAGSVPGMKPAVWALLAVAVLLLMGGGK